MNWFHIAKVAAVVLSVAVVGVVFIAVGFWLAVDCMCREVTRRLW